jgi:hypothetical protein
MRNPKLVSSWEPAPLLTLTMRGAGLRRSIGSSAWVRRHVPNRFVSITRRAGDVQSHRHGGDLRSQLLRGMTRLFRIPGGEDHLIVGGGQLARHLETESACRAGDQCDSFLRHDLSLLCCPRRAGQARCPAAARSRTGSEPGSRTAIRWRLPSWSSRLIDRSRARRSGRDGLGPALRRGCPALASGGSGRATRTGRRA